MFTGFLIKSKESIVFSIFSNDELAAIEDPLDFLELRDLEPKNGEITKHSVNHFNTYVYSPENIPSVYILIIGDLQRDTVVKAKRTFKQIDEILSPKYTEVLKTEKLSSAMFSKNKELKQKINHAIEEIEQKIQEEEEVVDDIRSQYFD